jgi:uncharacterized protein (TIGR02118 family)
VLAHLGIARAHVVAHSYAGAVALQLALDAPAAVHSLALLEPALFAVPSGEQFIAAVFGSAIERYGAGDRAGAVATVLRGVAGAAGFAAVQRALPGALELAEVDADTFFQTELPALQAWRFASEEARRIEQPLLVVRGADSDAVAPVFGEGIAMLRHWLPRVETFVVPEATHGMPFMNPCALAEGLTAFFARHSLPSRIRQSEDAVAHRARTRDQRETPSGINGAGANRDLPSISTASSVTQGASSVAGHQPVGPVKIVALYGPPDDPAAFERHYAETHVPLAQQLPGLQRLETALLLGTAQGGTSPYYRLADLWFSDIRQLQAAAASAEGQALAADVANFATGGVTVLVSQVDKPAAATVAGTAVI